MGTRAAFWVGDPADPENREWLGCIAWDGYPSALEWLEKCSTEREFRDAVKKSAMRHDFAAPDHGGWPFPWADDVFLTDYTYAFFGGAVQVCRYHRPFMPLADYLARNEDEDGERSDDPRHLKIPAPAPYDQAQPDSIMIIRI